MRSLALSSVLFYSHLFIFFFADLMQWRVIRSFNSSVEIRCMNLLRGRRPYGAVEAVQRVQRVGLSPAIRAVNTGDVAAPRCYISVALLNCFVEGLRLALSFSLQIIHLRGSNRV